MCLVPDLNNIWMWHQGHAKNSFWKSGSAAKFVLKQHYNCLRHKIDKAFVEHEILGNGYRNRGQ